MKTFRRLSAAVDFAAGRSYVRVQIGRDTVYLVADEGEAIGPHDSVEFVTSRNDRGQAEISGHVGFGHLDRLGNANSAAAAPGEYLRRKEFPIERRRGLCHVFQDAAEAAVFAADKDVFLGAARGAFTQREEPVAKEAWKDRAGYAWSDLGDGEAQRAIRDKVQAKRDELKAAEEASAQEAAFGRFSEARDAVRAADRGQAGDRFSVEEQADGTFAVFRNAGFQRGNFPNRPAALTWARDRADEAEEAEGRPMTIADVAERAAPSIRTVRHGFSDIDPRDLDPETGEPAAGYSSPSLDDSFHAGEMAVD